MYVYVLFQANYVIVFAKTNYENGLLSIELRPNNQHGAELSAPIPIAFPSEWPSAITVMCYSVLIAVNKLQMQ